MEPSYRDREKQSPTRLIVGAALASFLLGAAVAGYFAWRTGASGPEAGREGTRLVAGADQQGAAPGATEQQIESSRQLDEASEAASDVAEAAEVVERVAEQQGGFEQRLAAAEQRLARIDLQLEAAAGNAARAEGLLIAFATRRALERGAELGYLADQLRLRFGDALPNAVATVIEFSRKPVTIDQLMARLDALSAELRKRDGGVSWETIKREFSQLFVIRRNTTPSPQAADRLARARMFLESGRVEAAIAEIELMPGAEKARSWIADARRYAEAMRALDLIETAAVLEPRRLRDGAGNPIGQPSPARKPTAENGEN